MKDTEKQGVLSRRLHTKAAAISLELANITKTAEFAIENINRINLEIEKFDEQKESLVEMVQLLQRMILKRSRPILTITMTILASKDNNSKLDEELRESIAKKEKMSENYRGFCKAGGSFKENRLILDKELFRLNSQREKLKEPRDPDQLHIG